MKTLTYIVVCLGMLMSTALASDVVAERKANFKANSTLNWHKHTDQQVLIVISGKGYYQEKGKKPIVIKEGDILKCSANTEHWHASSKEQDVTYLAIYKGETEWTDILTQEAYDEVAELLMSN